ncbi:S66 peptidase family protein [Phaeocystidibacter luteus]|uniref:LD-carboxypeptidase n=1 Tax=Phaeocystidibacter luteus TaxID=911197 RepID=A0A6N6RJ52_9FLAO|nr:LD-carboxypeptidase [Phaeocystidibacter luteus]KAB2813644.1 LD-carboxypeptidase [Phaeocystidibacter luteus]
MIRPQSLAPGDTVLFTSTARKISPEELEPAIAWLEKNGLKWEKAPGLHEVENQFAGNDETRRKALQWCLDHPTARAIWCCRGGYGTVRIVDELNWEGFAQNPKWIIGYSDVTALHGEASRFGYSTLHATMPINVNSNTELALDSLKQALFSRAIDLSARPHELNQPGTAEGVLVGGNLSMLYSILGSTSQPNLDGNILFIEDLDEYLYHIDRMMMNFRRNGWFDKISGLVVGGMTAMNDNTVSFGEHAEEIIARHLKPFKIPVGFGFPIGHLEDNRAVEIGARVRLEVDGGARLIYGD